MEKAWFLESVSADGARITQTISKLPFRVGRDAGNDLAVDARGLSRQHALMEAGEGAGAGGGGLLRVTDLGSTNGTFVNRERISAPRLVAENDVIHFGTAEFRLGRLGLEEPAAQPEDTERTMIVPKGRTLSENFILKERPFMELLRGHGLSGAAQPIVDAQTGRIFAYELLGRCTHPELPASPIHLFQLAALLDREAELSEAFRNHGVRWQHGDLHGGGQRFPRSYRAMAGKYGRGNELSQRSGRDKHNAEFHDRVQHERQSVPSQDLCR